MDFPISVVVRDLLVKSGSWAHAMAWITCDDTGKEPAFLVQNSWGKWNSGGHQNEGPIPDGSFLIHADVAAGMLVKTELMPLVTLTDFLHKNFRTTVS